MLWGQSPLPATASFLHLGTDDGLSNNSINCIYKDRQGWVWVGTADGLNRYDGYEVKVYKHDPTDATSLSDNQITAICEDGEGNLWIGTRGQGLNKYIRNQETFQRVVLDDQQDIAPSIKGLLYDRKRGILWIAMEWSGLQSLNLKNGHSKHYRLPTPLSKTSNEIAECLYQDQKGRIWVGTWGGGLNCYDPSTGQYHNYLNTDLSPKENKKQPGADIIFHITGDQQGNLWLATWGQGVLQFHPDLGKQQYFTHANANLAGDVVSSLCFDSKGKLWAGTFKGLSILDTLQKKAQIIKHDPAEPRSVAENSLWCTYHDQEGITWLGTASHGVSYFAPYANKFYNLQPQIPGINSRDINYYAAVEHLPGQTYVLATSVGLLYYDASTQHYELFGMPNRQSTIDDVLSICIRSAQASCVWVANKTGTLAYFNLQKKSFVPLPGQKHLPYQSLQFTISTIQAQGDSILWIGTEEAGLLRYDIYSNHWTPIQPPGASAQQTAQQFITKLILDPQDRLWIGTRSGLFCHQQGKHHQDLSFLLDSYRHTSINEIFVDRQRKLWIATGTETTPWDLKRRCRVDVSSFFPAQQRYTASMQEDQQGQLWLSGSDGLRCWRPNTQTWNHYDQRDGLLANYFVQGSGMSLGDGMLFFGGSGGFCLFNPRRIRNNPSSPLTLLTGLKLSNKSVKLRQGTILNQPLEQTSCLKIPQKQASLITFTFSARNYTISSKNRYRYKLQFIDRQWNYAGNKNEATYTHLSPGHYIFWVQSANNDGVWSKKARRLELWIIPPWWSSTWFRITIFFMLLGGLIWAYHQRMKNLGHQNTLLSEKVKERTLSLEESNLLLRTQRDELEALSRQVQDLLDTKIAFFSNISHELRTPLSLISGPLEELAQHPSLQEGSNQKKLRLLRRNTQRMLNLTNQILDIQKLDAQHYPFQPVRDELGSFIQNILESFENWASHQHITLSYLRDSSPLFICFDADILDKILYNLIHNAIKFTPTGGRVGVELGLDESSNWVKIEVSDSGRGIATEHLPRIFDRFYQAHDSSTSDQRGTGLGLNLAQHLAHLHQGQLGVQSKYGEGTTFTLLLPAFGIPASQDETALSGPLSKSEAILVGQPKVKPVVSPETHSLVRSSTLAAPQAPLLLLIDDESDMRAYLADVLYPAYQLIEATNGVDGLRMAQQYQPDLILCDVSMPHLGGLDLCKQLKADDRTHHIPLILLTARAEESTQLRGITDGADDYVTKPFSVSLLQARIQNLLEQRQKLYLKYSQEIKIEPRIITSTEEDAALLERALAIVEKNLDNPDFSTDDFVAEMHIGRTLLYSKIKKITDQTVADFIRSIRLKRAAQLMMETNDSIAQIMLQVGFREAAYFAKCFRKEFNMLPSAFVNKSRVKI